MTESPTRPWRMILVCIGLMLFQAGAALQAVTISAEIAAQVRLPFSLQFVTGTLWALLFAFITVNLVRKQPRARTFAFWALLGFVTYSLLRLLLFAQADYDQQRQPFLILITLVILVIGATGLLQRPNYGDSKYGSKS